MSTDIPHPMSFKGTPLVLVRTHEHGTCTDCFFETHRHCPSAAGDPAINHNFDDYAVLPKCAVRNEREEIESDMMYIEDTPESKAAYVLKVMGADE